MTADQRATYLANAAVRRLMVRFPVNPKDTVAWSPEFLAKFIAEIVVDAMDREKDEDGW